MRGRRCTTHPDTAYRFRFPSSARFGREQLHSPLPDCIGSYCGMMESPLIDNFPSRAQSHGSGMAYAYWILVNLAKALYRGLRNKPIALRASDQVIKSCQSYITFDE